MGTIPNKTSQLLQDIKIKKFYSEDKQTLNLNSCQKNWSQLIEGRDLSMLSVLILSNCQITNISMFQNTQWTNLRELHLSNNKIKVEGIKMLIKINFPALQKINLSSCQIGNEGVKILTKSYWQGLNEISLYQNDSGLDGFSVIFKADWKNAIYLPIYNRKDEGFHLLYNDGIEVMSLAPIPSRIVFIYSYVRNYDIKLHVVQAMKEKFNFK